ncbi:acetyl-CoA carboxylase biotin carboxyl carrier protein [Parasphaerochaeta coccoides]|uniref:Biotin carboxyl carrier protein of acetyl-CoA carboxylase n=1 Tax=Parasphaerochaeta coccoides (strain ATCC BAA-1237 / DSM 17374 / SPN1) TaxID=760011 RepID=F4GJL8_PARC1|nr:acetyl-CoA carboxylase biotin carboxyl carrier protein [Parasphaerochaeta coccoides]AEC02765.1 acetyl-CoA carboxylase, biotin carboxyl carrier protein [Parasphaerochaeta coccoides DSM 17374]
MKIPTIAELLEIFERNTTGELDFSCPEYSLALKKPSTVLPSPFPIGATSPASSAGSVVAPSSGQAANQAAGQAVGQTADKAPDENSNLMTVTAPLVGVFYLTPAPDASPYVEQGSKVTKGTTICAIEAMKLYNELTADYDCEIVSIRASQGTLVEFGQPLFEVRRT